MSCNVADTKFTLWKGSHARKSVSSDRFAGEKKTGHLSSVFAAAVGSEWSIPVSALSGQRETGSGHGSRCRRHMLGEHTATDHLCRHSVGSTGRKLDGPLEHEGNDIACIQFDLA